MLAQHLFPSQTAASPPTGSCKALCSPEHDNDDCDIKPMMILTIVLLMMMMEVKMKVWWSNTGWVLFGSSTSFGRRILFTTKDTDAWSVKEHIISTNNQCHRIYHIPWYTMLTDWKLNISDHIFTCSWAQACHIRRMEAEELSTLLTWLRLYSSKSCSPPDIFQKSKKYVMSRKWTKEVWSKDE